MRAETEGGGHAEEIVEAARGVGVDRERGCGFAGVHWDYVRLAAAYNDDLCGWGEGGEGGRGDGF